MKYVTFAAMSLCMISPVLGEEEKKIETHAAIPSIEKSEEVLRFWFGTLQGPDEFPKSHETLWRGGGETARLIESNFGELFLQAADGQLDEWRQTARGRLALILLLDQFSRHLYPQSAKGLALDPMARGLVLEGLQRGDDKKLFPIERAFFYLPLERAEEKRMQELSVASYTRLLQESPESIKPHIQGFFETAYRNQQIIKRFGRFPHRNGMLGRKSTPEELIFLRSHRPS